MKVIDLLNRVKENFIQLIYKEDAQLRNLLIHSLATYQEKTGAQLKIEIADCEHENFERPFLFLKNALCIDHDGVFTEVKENADDTLSLILDNSSIAPFTMTYHIDFDQLDLDSDDLPRTAARTQIMRHLELLIEAKNTPLLRRVLEMGKLDQSDLRDAQTIQDQIVTVEEEMKNSRGMIPIASTR